MRRRLTWIVLILAFQSFVLPSAALEISGRYRSPRNPERKIRRTTDLIVLHTTEAPARSSLNKLCDRGEAHFCVTENGGVYAIVDRDREAFHAGRSMWYGREDVDKYSIGIECVGYHNKMMPAVQIAAIRDLLKMLKAMYRVPDNRVVCHSHVAYGMPNKWQRQRHRGRKRCGMLFAMPSMRRALGLSSRPAFDPDTRAHRLTVGDDYLRKVLYGGVDTMRGRQAPAAAASTSSDTWLSRLLGRKKTAQPAAPKSKPKVQPAPKPKPKPKPAVKVKQKTPAAKIVPPKSIAELKSRGFVMKGKISATVTAAKLVGRKWNAADTYYTIRNKVIPGNKIKSDRIEKGMGVWRHR